MRKIINTILIVLISLNVLYIFSGSIHYSFTSIDTYSIWLLKAKALFTENSFPFNFLSNHAYLYSHPQYPILLPLVFSIIYQIMGNIHEQFVLLLYPLIYTSILLLCFTALRKLGLSRTQGFLFTYVYSMLSPLLAQGGRMHAGNADIVITLFYWISYLFILAFYKTKRANYYWFLIVIVMIASQIKQEGLFLTAALIFLPTTKGKKILGLVLSLIPSLIWWYIIRSNNIPQSFGLTLYSWPVLVVRSLQIIESVVKEMLNIKNWYVFWVIFWVLELLQKQKDKFVRIIMAPTLIVIVVLFLSVYVFSTLAVQDYVASSVDRIMLQLSPFFFTIFAVRITKLLKRVSIPKF
jgi:hypothetical protein